MLNDKSIKYATLFLGHIVKMTTHRRHHHKRQRVILTYHGVSSKPQKNCVTQDLLDQQISWLKGKYSIVPLSNLVMSLKSASATETSDHLSLTFDDGYSNFAALALPILQKHKCHATLFVPAGKVGGYNDWDEGTEGFQKMEVMSYRGLRSLPNNFVEIGSHGISHRPLNHKLSIIEITREIVESRIQLEDKIGRSVRFFSFPFGAYPSTAEFMRAENQNVLWGGYEAACTSRWGRYNSEKDIFKLRRIGVWHSDSFFDFVQKLNGYYDWLEEKERIARYIKTRKLS